MNQRKHNSVMNKPRQNLVNKGFVGPSFNPATNGNRNQNNRMKNPYNFDYQQQHIDINAQQYILNAASQAFMMPNNMFFNGHGGAGQTFNPVINQQQQSQFSNDLGSFFYDQNNNSNNNNFQLGGTVHSGFQPEGDLQVRNNEH